MQHYYSSSLMQNQNNIKRIWKIMKEISGTKKFKSYSFHMTLKIRETEITKFYEFGNEFNSFLTGIANTIKIFNDYKKYLIPSENDLKLYELAIEEFETAFKLLKRNKTI